MGYPSDITREQFEAIRPILENARKKTRPRVLDLHAIFNAVLYIVKTGCQWEALPKEYPKWKSVHYYFLVWSKKRDGQAESVLGEVLKKIGRGGAYRRWQETRHFIYHRGRAER